MNKVRQSSISNLAVRLTLAGLILVLSSSCSPNRPIKPFTTDGCSVFPDGTLSQRTLWLQCCSEHDIAYWQGGSYQQRRDADNELQACVARVGEEKIAQLMLAGVRVGGTPYLPTPFRWGYGWPYPRGYRELTNEEAQQAAKQLPTN